MHHWNSICFYLVSCLITSFYKRHFKYLYDIRRYPNVACLRCLFFFLSNLSLRYLWVNQLTLCALFCGNWLSWSQPYKRCILSEKEKLLTFKTNFVMKDFAINQLVVKSIIWIDLTQTKVVLLGLIVIIGLSLGSYLILPLRHFVLRNLYIFYILPYFYFITKESFTVKCAVENPDGKRVGQTGNGLGSHF